jgi:hypothetical protein
MGSAGFCGPCVCLGSISVVAVEGAVSGIAGGLGLCTVGRVV